MSRHLRQRRLGRLRETLAEKVNLLQRQKADLLGVVETVREYVSEAETAAASLLQSEAAEMDVERYLHVIRQLDRCSQVCLQLTTKAYDIMDANEGSESGDEEDTVSKVSAGNKQALDSDGHPPTSSAAAKSTAPRQQTPGVAQDTPELQQPSAAADKGSPSASSMPEADQAQVQDQPQNQHHEQLHQHSETAAPPSTTVPASNTQLPQYPPHQVSTSVHPSQTEITGLQLRTALLNAYSASAQSMVQSYPPSFQLNAPLGQNFPYPYGTFTQVSVAGTHPSASLGPVANLIQPGAVQDANLMQGGLLTAQDTNLMQHGSAASQPNVAGASIGASFTHPQSLGMSKHLDGAQSLSGVLMSTAQSMVPAVRTHSVASHPVAASIGPIHPSHHSHAPSVSTLGTVPPPHLNYAPSVSSLAPSTGSRNSPEGAGVEPDTFWRLAIGVQYLPSDHAVPLSVCFVESPWSFYVLPSEETVTRLTQEIRNHVEHTKEHLLAPKVGDLCLAKYAADDMHYRARVQHDHGESVGVYFLDFGNVQTAMKSELLVLPNTYRGLPPLAVHCCLHGVMPASKSGLWTETAVSIFTQSTTAQKFMCRAVRQATENPPIPTVVELTYPTSTPAYSGSKKKSEACSVVSLASVLIKQKVAQPVDMPKLLELLTASSGTDGLPLGAEANMYTASGQSLLAGSPPTQKKKKKKKSSDQAPEKAPLSPNAKEFIPHSHHAAHGVPRPPGLSESAPTNLAHLEPHIAEPKQSAHSHRAKGDNSSHHHSSKAGGGPEHKTRKGDNNPQNEVTERKSGSDLKTNKSDTKSTSHSEQLVHGQTTSDSEMDWKSVFTTLLGVDSDSPDSVTNFRAMPAAVRSPSDFYIHRVSEATGNRLKDMMKDLNTEFEHMPKTTMERQSRSFIAKPGNLCCARFSKDNCFYRAIVLHTRTGTDLVSDSSDSDKVSLEIEVFYIDFGDEEWLPNSRVFPLPLTYQYVPPQALWCSLLCVRPHASGEWSAEACKAFSELLGTEHVLTVITQSEQIPTEKCRADAVQEKPLGVLLVDQDDEDLCINHELILQGHAVLINGMDAADQDGGAVHCFGKEEESEEGWDDMKRDAESLRNTYNVDTNDAGVAISGVKAKGRSRGVCRFYHRPSSCWKGKQCPYLHVEPGTHPDTSGNLKQVLVFDEDQSTLLPEEGTLVAVEVSSIRSPCHFYVTLPWGPLSISQVTSMSTEALKHQDGETLETLNVAMNEYYKKKRLDTDYSVYAMGEAVAAYCRRTGAWLRGKVIDTDPEEEEVWVLFVDLGDKEWISEHDIRQLEKRFIHLPPQAVECCLIGVAPPKPLMTWPAESRREFLELVKDKTLAARVVQRMWSGRLMVELIDTSKEEDLDVAKVLISRGMASAERSRALFGSPRSPSSARTSPHDGGDDVQYIPG